MEGHRSGWGSQEGRSRERKWATKSPGEHPQVWREEEGSGPLDVLPPVALVLRVLGPARVRGRRTPVLEVLLPGPIPAGLM